MITTTVVWTERAADNWHIIAIACLIVGILIGWALVVRSLRNRVKVTPTGDNRWAVTIGRAVAGDYDHPSLAQARAADIRRQIAGIRPLTTGGPQ